MLMCLLVTLLMPSALMAAAKVKNEIKDVRYFASKDYTRVVVGMVGNAKFKRGELKDVRKLYFDIENTRIGSFSKRTIMVENAILTRIRVGQFDSTTVRVVFDLDNYGQYRLFTLTDPNRIIVDIFAGKGGANQADEEQAAKKSKESLQNEPVVEKSEDKSSGKPADKPSEESKKEITRGSKPDPSDSAHNKEPKDTKRIEPPFAKKRIVIDPGHGGHDPGAIGKTGMKEKHIVLDVALRLAKLLRDKYHYEVFLTRNKDVFISLEERTAIANSKAADLFVSVHANANNTPSIKGIETYFLNFTDDKEALRVAARENAISITKMKQVQSELGVILASLARESKRDESLRLSHFIQKSMVSHLNDKFGGVVDNGVRQALFYVLVGASMPSALVEISYLTNAQEEKLLKTNAYKEELAASIARGIGQYVSTLPDAPEYASASAAKRKLK
ncbi:MAG: N-acetylmuramoyl-L-alanine amidase [Nitrospirae bacterium]|nr:N-acetylmuramoyl-L-alanine amidase [Nitrospirota bacterium]